MNTQPASLNRRDFITRSALASAGATALLNSTASAADASPLAPAPGVRAAMPTGRLGKLTLSRLVSGGNLLSGWAHSRDLQYVPELMRHYNTDDKVLETLQLLEEHGVNTIICDPRDRPMALFKRYWKERGGKIQWIAEGHPGVDDWKTDIKRSIDFGASAVYVQGVIGDKWLREGRLDLLGNCVEFVKSRGVPAGIGAHKLEVIMGAEKNGYGAEFYVKTLHHTKYWSTRRPDQQADVVENGADNYWDFDPARTVAFMQEVKKPWIAFKVLAAGAIRPESGFRYAFENGADFIAVGMFDFQVAEDAALVRKLLPQYQNRERPWSA